jgi:hypothetical protein
MPLVGLPAIAITTALAVNGFEVMEERSAGPVRLLRDFVYQPVEWKSFVVDKYEVHERG